jgi:hypothetical protein
MCFTRTLSYYIILRLPNYVDRVGTVKSENYGSIPGVGRVRFADRMGLFGHVHRCGSFGQHTIDILLKNPHNSHQNSQILYGLRAIFDFNIDTSEIHSADLRSKEL